MLRLLIAAAVLLGAAYFYLNQGGDDERVLDAQQQALEKAKEVEKIAADRVNELNERLEEQEQADPDDDQP